MNYTNTNCPLIVLLDNINIPNWMFDVLNEIVSKLNVKLEVIVLKNNPESEALSLKDKVNAIPYKAFMLMDESVTANSIKRHKGVNAFLLKDVRLLCENGVDVIDLNNNAVVPMEAVNCKDLVIDLSSKDSLFKKSLSPSVGFVSFSHTDPRQNRDGPACVWEYLGAQDYMVSTLILTTNNGDTIPLERITHRAKTAKFLGNMRNSFYWKSSAMLPRNVQRILLNPKIFDVKVKLEAKLLLKIYDRPYRGNPGFSDGVKLWCQFLKRNILGRKKSTKKWHILYQFSGDKKLNLSVNMHEMKKVESPKNEFWADPFPVYQNGRYYIFFENYPYDVGRAHISCVEWDGEQWSDAVDVLKEDVHLSYPQVFKYKDEYYMIPETRNSNQIRLYKSTCFPYSWEFEKVLIDNISAVDSTFFYHEGTCWLFSSCRSSAYTSDDSELHIFYSDGLMGEWHAHDQNPVNSDILSARPAGNLFLLNNHLIRPSQSSKLYGYSMVFNEVQSLSKSHYAERPLDKIEPKWRQSATKVHTFNMAEKLTVMDSVF